MLELDLISITKSNYVSFAQGSSQATHAAKDVKFKSGTQTFEEDFTINVIWVK
jgi:hypothetical protein